MRVGKLRTKQVLPVIVTPAATVTLCQAVTTKGRPCRLEAGPDGYCGAFHKPPARKAARR